MDERDILPTLIAQQGDKISPEWEPLRDVLRQVQTEIRAQEEEAVNKLARVRAKEEFCKEWDVGNLFELYLFTALAAFLFLSIPFVLINALSGALLGPSMDWLTLLLAPPILITPPVIYFSSRAVRLRTEQIIQYGGIMVDTNEALREAALASASPEIKPALSDAFDDAFILMDQLKVSEDSDPAIAGSMQGLRQTIGGMIIGGAVVNKIDEYLTSRPEHIKRAIAHEGELGKEVDLCKSLSANRRTIVENIEKARQDISLLRGGLLQVQSHAVEEGMDSARLNLQYALETTQARAEALNELNETTLARLRM
jgi:methyl-accepting chemotaxis protein